METLEFPEDPRLNELIDRAARGETIRLKHGQAAARIVPEETSPKEPSQEAFLRFLLEEAPRLPEDFQLPERGHSRREAPEL
jgi:antitoxin (DNA-binding transcriptional repressor) of toxin-antitoxin stability system